MEPDRFETSPTAAPRSDRPAGDGGGGSQGRISTSRIANGTEIGGDFVIERPLAEGGMGAVYVALQRSTGVRRALKVMHETLSFDESLTKRFRREAELAATVESDHVVKVLTAGHDATLNVAYLVMELLAGASLARGLDTLAPLSPAMTSAILTQVAHGLGAAGDLGIVHRDVKPENIFLCRASSATAPFFVKLLDFGVAKDVKHASRVGTQAVGTPFWLAPEQTESDPHLSPATDVWPFGLVAYACLVGRPFWKSAGSASNSTPAAFLRELLLEPIPTPSVRAREHGIALPDGFDAWFARCVDRDPSKRFPEARIAARVFAETVAAPQPLAGETDRLVQYLREEAAQTSNSYIGFEPTIATPNPLQKRPSLPERFGTAPSGERPPASRGGTVNTFAAPALPAAVLRPRADAPETGPIPMSEPVPKSLYMVGAVVAIACVAALVWPRGPKPPIATATKEVHGLRAGNYLCRLAPTDDFNVPCVLTAKSDEKLEMTVNASTATCYVTIRRGDGNAPPSATGFCNRERGIGAAGMQVHGPVRLSEAETYEIPKHGADDIALSFRGPIAK